MTSNTRIRRLLTFLLVFSLIAAACGGGDDDDSSAGGGDSSSDSGDSGDSGDDGGVVDDSGATGADESADGSAQVTEEGVEAQFGGTLRIGLEAEPSSLNPTNTGLAVTGVMMGQAIFDTLTVWGQDDQWANNLSESWTPSDDFLSWDMKLRDGITFSDGGVMDADAVLKTLNAQLADPLVGLVFKPTFDPNSPFEKVDDLT
ncbi:MAG: hypothetical protein KJN63_12065, partial [Acidimicrobiia bacterium]|nr:hypothetical protein [Acidimicrobiia bacterium]